MPLELGAILAVSTGLKLGANFGERPLSEPVASRSWNTPFVDAQFPTYRDVVIPHRT